MLKLDLRALVREPITASGAVGTGVRAQTLTSAARTQLACTLATAIACAGLFANGNVFSGSLRVPLRYEGDALLYLGLVKVVHESGWQWTNPRLSAPHGFHLYDLPMPENFHFLTLKALCVLTGNPVAALNLFVLLQFPAAALTGTWVLRRFGLGVIPSALGGVLFAYLPHHCIVYPVHIFLGCYYPIPLAVWLAVQVFTDKLRLAARDTRTGRLRPPYLSGGGIGALAIAALVASTGAYYAFFTAALLTVAAIGNALERRQVARAVPGQLLTGVVFAGLVVNLTPALVYHKVHGSNPEIRRHPPEGNVYALRPAELLLPSPLHRVERLAKLHTGYMNKFGPTVNDTAYFTPLGVVGACGLLYALVTLLRRRADAPHEVHLQVLSRLLVATLLIGVIGGFGPLFNHTVSPWVRCYYRIAVFTGFLAVAAAAIGLDQIAGWARGRLVIGPAVQAALVALIGIGLYDQTSPKHTRSYKERAAEFRSDQAFVRTVERALPPGTAVFQLPYLRFPESGGVLDITDYRPFIPFVHSEMLRWSYGASKGRAPADWQAAVVEQEPEAMARSLVFAGFGAVWVDRWGYPGHAAPLETGLDRLADGPPLTSPDGRHAIYHLAGFARALRSTLPADEWERQTTYARHPPVIRWVEGFGVEEVNTLPGWRRGRWCEAEGALEVTNTAPGPQRLRLRFTATPHAASPCQLEIEGPQLVASLVIAPAGTAFDRELELPPGTHTFRFRCNGAPHTVYDRTLVFRLHDLTLCPADEAGALPSRLSSTP